jgi:peptidoglycan/xylan/chitin deacetylase (PgdA/CDA1 family)
MKPVLHQRQLARAPRYGKLNPVWASKSAGAMRKILLAMSALLLAAGPVAAAPKEKSAAPVRTALFQEKTIFKSGITHQHTIALTFDDGPNAHTNEVLDALREMGVKATFFIVGNQAHRHPDILARIAREGHLLANHSATHGFLGSSYDADPDRLLEQVRDVDDQIAPLMARSDKFYFRAPYGQWKYAHAGILNADRQLRKYVGPIYWDVGGDTRMSADGYVMSATDWDCWRIKWSARTCAKGYTREIRRKDGGVVLMHCIHVNSAELVRQVVPVLIEEGYRFVRLDEMPRYRRYETPKEPAHGVADARSRLLRLSSLRAEDLK